MPLLEKKSRYHNLKTKIMRNLKQPLLVAAAMLSSFFASAQWVTNGTNTHHTNTGNVYIGDVPPLFPAASGKLHVKNLTGGVVRNSIYSQMSVTTNTGFGASSIFANLTSGSNITGGVNGVTSIASTSSNTVVKGIDARSTNSNNTQGLAYGVYAEALSSNCDAITQPIALYGRISVPFACTGTNGWALYADGRTFTPSGVWTASDSRLKSNIASMSGAMEMVKLLQPKSYEFRKDGVYASSSLPTGLQYGFLAQDLEKVLPSVVTEAPLYTHGKDGQENNAEIIKAVNYNALIAVLTAAIKELEQRLAAVENQLATKTGVKPSAAKLYQNNPNPAARSTTIRYELPAGTGKAFIHVYDMQGRQVKQWAVGSSNGTVTIKEGELGSGVYVYSLMVDGKEADSRRMILTGE
jgi:Chaperone of endosialidase/Secretion system C-terminal sorting domain